MVAPVATKVIDNPMADNAIEYARQVWLAGLGALAKAEKEGSKLFDTLVQRGEELEASLLRTEGKHLFNQFVLDRVLAQLWPIAVYTMILLIRLPGDTEVEELTQAS